MYRKYLVIFVLWMISGSTALIAQDSISVWKIEYEYKSWSADTLVESDAQFANIAIYGRATLYYADSVYRIRYADDYWEIGDFNASHRYAIYHNIAREGLSIAQQRPELYDLPDVEFPMIVWAKDYDLQGGRAPTDIMGISCDMLVFHPQHEAVDAAYEVYVSGHIPKIPWYPYSFMSRLPTGFLGFYKTNAARSQVEGFEAKEINQVNVPTGFFEVPEGMKIERMVAPPQLND